jgi:protein CWC15
MTTAHRPTWKPAVGRQDEGGWSAVSTATSALDAPAHTKLKFRQSVDRKAALEKSLLQLEEAAEASTALKKRPPVDPAIEEQGKQKLLKQTTEVDETALKKKYDDSDVDDGGGASDEESDLDADDSDLDDDSSDDEDDDEAALQAELAKIRAEREQAKQKVEEAAAKVENSKLEEAALVGNPLLSGEIMAGSAKRRWNEDVVFRNQAKGEPAPKKRFINDTVRNDFHRRFLNKFIR